MDPGGTAVNRLGQSMKDDAMPWKEPHWWALAGTVIAAFLGWRVKTASDAVRLQIMGEDVRAIKKRIAEIEREAAKRDAKLAADQQQLTDIKATLIRIERQLEGKVNR